jgi:hypothetical protein
MGTRIAKLPAEQRADLEPLIARITKIALRIESNVNAIVKASRSVTSDSPTAEQPRELDSVIEALTQRFDDIPTKDPS